MNTLQKSVDELFAAEDWRNAESYLLTALDDDPESHWILCKLSGAAYQQYDYGRALGYAERALEIAPDCPLVLWEYASALVQVGRHPEAIEIARKIIRYGAHRRTFDDCWENRRWARSLLTDCLFLLGASYLELGDRRRGRDYLRKHLRSRRRGIYSDYTVETVRRLYRSS